MGITFNDPFRPAIAAAEELYPNLSLKIVLVDGLVDLGGFAATAFPDDGGPAHIEIDHELPLHAVAITLLHELAHAVVGLEDGHGKKWEEAFMQLAHGYAKHMDGGSLDDDDLKNIKDDIRASRRADKAGISVKHVPGEAA
ncbi:hypothetical protein Sp245p_03360 [Azospirillum baldaniorum]|uniref:hypothetical protein n=1 Tax=Azospirillum baldaniorum TaxID=1064539 RepID=UPI0002F9BC3C|nr:hypothetical protein [Azospirillum baldaniorum]AWJ88892.1 hypothetical protein Sp245p_03360 [Azospirillum baldaniorum]TWA73397.1 hypothetical protein FBZ85_11689 [Azospirillum brasilense]